jgi:hypothetical protein
LSLYEIGLLGSITEAEVATLSETIGGMVADFDLQVDRDVMIRVGADFDKRNDRSAGAASYLGGLGMPGQEAAQRAVVASVPVIPAIWGSEDWNALVPGFLQHANGLRRRVDDPAMRELATALLECVGLLWRQRRVFVSYRRLESRSAAVQLHDLLGARGFEVFLDTHHIRPGEAFQDVLWHRLCDSDVLLMLDTATYFESKWTRQELGRARAKEIHVLRVVWPEHRPSRQTDFAETVFLNRGDLGGEDGPIVDAVADRIVMATENLRSRSIASRYRSITGKLRVEVERIGGAVDGIGAHRAVSLRLPDDKRVWAYPMVGIPTAELLYDVAGKARRADQAEIPILVYDEVGIRDQWIAHLKWLGENITTVKAIPVSRAGWELAAWGAGG